MKKHSTPLRHYVTPQIKIFELASGNSLLDGSAGGGHVPANPDPNGDIEGVRKFDHVQDNYWDWSTDSND